MVGVPRSKGCRTCVQRRVKCDQTRPACQRCQKHKVECPGYGQTVKFQDEGAKLRRHFAKKEELSASTAEAIAIVPLSPSSSSSSSSSSSDVFSETSLVPSTSTSPVGSPRYIWEKHINHSPATPGDEFLPYTAIVNSVMSPAIFQSQLMGMFVGDIAPERKTVPKAFSNQMTWLTTLANSSPGDIPDALSASIRALSLSHIGRTNKSKDLVELSRQQYGLALRQLSQTIRDRPDTDALSSATLSATMLLSFYEMFHATNGNGWVRHAGGAGALIRARGPELATATDLDRIMLMAYRNALIIQAFEAGTACFLAEPAWTKVTRGIYNSTSDGSEFSKIAEEFFEEMAHLPAVARDARDFDHALTDPDRDAVTEFFELKARSIQHRHNVKSLFTRLQAHLQLKGNYTTTKPARNPDETLFPSQIHYPNIFVASLHCGHWICLTIMNTIIMELLRLEESLLATASGSAEMDYDNVKMTDMSLPFVQMPPPPPPLDSPSSPSNEAPNSQVPTSTGLREESISNCRKCCRSVDFMSSSVFHGPFIITFGLRTSLLAFSDIRERIWVKNKLKEIGRKFGMAGEVQVEDGEKWGFSKGEIEKQLEIEAQMEAQMSSGRSQADAEYM